MSSNDFFSSHLQDRKQALLFRKTSRIKGLDFCSNDYLGLSGHPYIRKKMIQALEGGLDLSAKASRLLGGTNPLHEKAEEALRIFLNRPAVLSFPSGWQANIGLIPALAGEETVIFSDQLNHASLIDGIRLSKQPYHIFRHRDLDHLETLLKTKRGKRNLIVTESLFSMEGDFCPLEDISCLALQYNALLLVDEAHSTGLFGKNGRGFVGDLKETDHIVSVHTGGKALGNAGAFVGSSSLIKNYLINNCRSFIYSTAPPPLLMAQWLAGLEVLNKERHRAVELRQKASWFRKQLFGPRSQKAPLLNSSCLKTPPSCHSLEGRNPEIKHELSNQTNIKDPVLESPIIYIPMKGPGKALHAAKKLRERGFFIQAIRYPTVPKENQGLRALLHWDHKTEQLENLKKNLLALCSPGAKN